MKRDLIILALLILISIMYSQTAPDWLWATTAGGAGYEGTYSITADDSGNSYVTGYFQGTATFGETTLTSHNEYDYDIFIAKLDPSGSWLWAKSASGLTYDWGYDITTDIYGNCFATGHFMSSATFGTITLSSTSISDEIFVAKLDTNGNWLWARRAGGDGGDWGNGISTDNNGNCYVTGFFEDTATFGTTSLTSNGLTDIFVAKLDTNGNWLWARSAGDAYMDCGFGIDTDSDGNSYITGAYRGSVAFGTNYLDSMGEWNIFAAKLDPNGEWIWAAGAGETNFLYNAPYRIAADSNGNVYVCGYYTTSVTFGYTILTSSGQRDIFIAKLDPNGYWLWARSAGGTSQDFASDVSTDSYGNCFMTGYFWDNTTFGTLQFDSNGYSDAFVAKLDPNGNWLWVKTAGGVSNDYGDGISTTSNGISYVSGRFNATVTLGESTLTSSGENDIFVAKLASDGTPIDDEVTPYNTSFSQLYNAYPNPMHQGNVSTIKAEIAPSETGNISIYNIKGQVVECYKLASGSQSISFSGKGLATGIYFYQLKTPSVREVKKLVILNK